MYILSVINQKGGVGKSTTTHAVGIGLMRKGYSVLFVDLDAQGNLSYAMGANTEKGVTIFDLLTRTVATSDAIQQTAQGNIIAASPQLAGADMFLTATGKEFRLKEALEPLQGKYDFVIIDTPPALGVLSVNALTACAGAIIPAQADIFSIQGIDALAETLETVRQYCNPEIKLLGIVMTRYSNRAILSREIAEMSEQKAEQLGTRLFATRIRECTALKEAQIVQQDIYTYAPKSNAAVDYAELVTEILKEVQKNGR